MRSIKIVGLFAALGAFIGSEAAAEKLTLASVPIPTLFESASKGPMFDYIQEIGRRAGIEFEIRLLPVQRLEAAFAAGEIDAIGPIMPSQLTMDLTYVPADFGTSKTDVAIVRKGEPAPASVEDLKGKTVAVALPEPVSPILVNNPDIRLSPGPNTASNLQRLIAGRVDVVVSELHSTLGTARALSIDGQIDAAIATPLYVEKALFGLQPGPGNEALASRINAAVAEIIADGTWSRIWSAQMRAAGATS